MRHASPVIYRLLLYNRLGRVFYPSSKYFFFFVLPTRDQCGRVCLNLAGNGQISQTESSLLDAITLVDTPGVLSGEKQRIGRQYDFIAVCKWFAERADMILLLFDAHKLDISDEFKSVIETLKGHDEKIRVVLNKADRISNQQLMRWSLFPPPL